VRVKSKGTVYLVGAGPGDAGLLTLRGAELLGARTWCPDALVNPDLLRLAPPSAELIARGKNMTMPQEEIIALLIAGRAKAMRRAAQGRRSLHFWPRWRGAEALAAAKIHFEVVPGVSSIVAAPNYAGIPLTHREHCSSFTVFTAHENPADIKADCATIKSPKSRHQGRAHGHRPLDDWTNRSSRTGCRRTAVAWFAGARRAGNRLLPGHWQPSPVWPLKKKLSPPC